MSTKMRKKMNKERKMRERQIKVFCGMGFLVTLAAVLGLVGVHGG